MRHLKLFRALLFVVSLLPLLWLTWRALGNHLGPDPAKELVDELGLWAIRFLLLSMAMTPLRLLSGKSFWVAFRRQTGLFAFFYAVLHVLVYVFLLFGAEWQAIASELSRRPYIIAGLAALACLLPLAVTSTRGWQQRLGRRWKSLHKLVYVAALLAMLHFIWLKKLGIYAVWPYALLLLILLAVRIAYRWRKA